MQCEMQDANNHAAFAPSRAPAIVLHFLLHALHYSFLALFLLASTARADEPVSYHKEIRPLLTANCNACHKPEKNKGGLDMTTYASLMKGGKNGSAVVPGDLDKSLMVSMVRGGKDAEMPPEGDPLKPEQVALIERWIKQGAKDDTPAPGSVVIAPPVYTVPPSISAVAYSPDGKLLAVSGYHEVLLHQADGSAMVARLVGEATRIESIAFDSDGSHLGVAGGAPSEFGQVQVWDVKTHKPTLTVQPSTDSLYGLSFSPDGKTIAVAAADKVVRLIGVDDGKVDAEFKAHADWVLGTAFTLDGRQLVTASRDKAMKLVEVATNRFVDDINNPLDPIVSFCRHPKEELVLYGGMLGGARIYKISDNQKRTNGRIDTNLVVDFERQPGPVSAVAFSPDGSRVALGSSGLVRIYDAKGKPGPKPAPRPEATASKPGKPAPPPGNELLTLTGGDGPTFAIAWKPDGSVIATGGFDGKVRLYDATSGSLIKEFVPVPIAAGADVRK